MTSLKDLEDPELVAHGQTAIAEERLALVRTPSGRRALFEEIKKLHRPNRTRRLNIREAIVIMADLADDSEPPTADQISDYTNRLASTAWPPIRAAVHACDDKNDPDVLRWGTQLGAVIGEIFERHRGIFYNNVLRYRKRDSQDFDDILQDMIVAVPSAIERFDPSRGVNFNTLLGYILKLAALLYFEKAPIIRPSKRAAEIRRESDRYLNEHELTLGEDIHLWELAEILGVTEERLITALPSLTFIDKKRYGSDERETAESVIPAEEPEINYDSSLLVSRIDRHLQRVSPDHSACLLLRMAYLPESIMTSMPLSLSEARERLLNAAAATLDDAYQAKD